MAEIELFPTQAEVDAAAWHIGRSWGGHPLEDACPCPQQPCGLIRIVDSEGCPEHDPINAKTMRQGHQPDRCPGAA